MNPTGANAVLPPSVQRLAAIPPAGRRWRALLDTGLDLLFPPRCAGCGHSGTPLCPACLESVQAVPTPVCRRCGTPGRSPALCPHCQGGDFQVNAIRAAGIYRHPLSTAIDQLKYQGQPNLAQPLARLMSDYWLGREVSADLVAAVPLHEDRLRERGFNQSELLAERFCRRTGLPLLAPGPLIRTRATRQQVSLNAAERQNNMAGAFAWTGPHLAGAKVLLIDDVATSGATLEACGGALRQAGAAKVWALTVARAVGDGSA